ncbi:uncharacterized protein LOC108134542 isoform X2 [Drosophila elegans]|uniref:uncharacterized protein LOC108134542 isoform X2 n=1 Tax=Drosophila elegans TaxID=30023 RepID=UPI001BC864DD|nr:uncharacterized protein LOC108134542 isoform X2 [Drosophila elegans]
MEFLINLINCMFFCVATFKLFQMNHFVMLKSNELRTMMIRYGIFNKFSKLCVFLRRNIQFQVNHFVMLKSTELRTMMIRYGIFNKFNKLCVFLRRNIQVDVNRVS